jgi:mannitol/fructose-specific phosphotransferase system IIA component (Ntr-type)
MLVSAPCSPDDFFGPNPSAIELRATNAEDAIGELVDHLIVTRKIEREAREGVITAVNRRELSQTTGIGFGIAVPHCSTELVTDVVHAIGFSRKGIQFNALDGKLVDLVLLFLVPSGQFQKHLHNLANIAKLLHRDDFRDKFKRRFL